MSPAAVMRVLVVHESLFGNTRAVAQAVAAGIASALPDVDVECRSVLDVPPDAAGADLLVVGGPTHFWGVTSALSRAMELQYERRIRPRLHPAGSTAGRRAADTAGVREWLADLPSGRGRPAAAFDTRIERPLTGGAAPWIGRRLRRRGYRLVAAPEAFVVERVAGPLRAGEEDRARAWGIELATAAAIDPTTTIKEFVPPPRHPGWETTMSTTSAPAVVDVALKDDERDRPAHHSPSAFPIDEGPGRRCRASGAPDHRRHAPADHRRARRGSRSRGPRARPASGDPAGARDDGPRWLGEHEGRHGRRPPGPAALRTPPPRPAERDHRTGAGVGAHHLRRPAPATGRLSPAESG